MSKAAKPPIAKKSVIGEQFKATKIWYDLVDHLYKNANVKKRRSLMKSHGDCFSGANAVDTLLSYVQINAGRFPITSTVTRENIGRLCQSFLDSNIFECVNAGDDDEKKTKFEDSHSRLYHFNQENERESHSTRKESISSNKDKLASAMHDVEGLPSKFSTLTTGRKSSDRPKTMLSLGTRVRKKSISSECRASSSQMTDSSGDGHRLKCDSRKSPKLRRKTSLLGKVIKRSCSDSNISKNPPETPSSQESKHCHPNSVSKGKVAHSNYRLSFRKKAMSHFSQSYQLHRHCATENLVDLVAEEENELISDDVFSRKDGKRRSSKFIIPSSQCGKVKTLSTKPRERKLTRQEMSRLKRECARVRLLQILDLPFIETVVISPTIDKKVFGVSQTENQLVNRRSSINYSEITPTYNNDDMWIFNAHTVLQHVPDGHSILMKYARLPEQNKKIALYLAIANYYSSLRRPLIDENYNGIAVAIINLLASKPVENMMEPVQLYVHLLPDDRLSELRHLCMFLHAVYKQKEIKVLCKNNSQAFVIKNFTPAILRITDTSSLENGLEDCKGLVRFMIQHHLQVFMYPASIETIVQRKADMLEQGDIESPSAVLDSAYCPLISEAEYNAQAASCTQMELQSLYDHISGNSCISPRKKKTLMKKFHQHHPDVTRQDGKEQESSGGGERKTLLPRTSFSYFTRSKSSVKNTDLTESTNQFNTEEKKIPSLQNSQFLTASQYRKLTPPASDPLTRKRGNNSRTEFYL